MNDPTHRPHPPSPDAPLPPRAFLRVPECLLLGLVLSGAGCSPGPGGQDQFAPSAAEQISDALQPDAPALPDPSTAGPAQEGTVLADGRFPAPERTLPPTPSALADALERARAHWDATEPGWEEEFQVMDMARGAFLGADAQQEVFLYLASRWPRCCPKMGLVVLQEGSVVRHLAFVGVAQQLRAIPDLDGDGREELWMEGAFGMGGFNSSSATLLALPPGGGVREWGTVPTGENGCAAGGEDREARTYRIVAHPGPAFTIEGFRASCEVEGWEALGGPEPLVPDPAGGMEYVALPVDAPGP